MHEMLTTLGDWVKLFGPIFAGLGLLWKYFLKKKYDEFKLAHQNLQKIIEYIPKIERIEFELKPNGGSSVKDAINRIESAIKLQDKKLLTFFQSMPFGTFIADKSGNWTDVNLMLCRITERHESELKGKNWLRWVIEDDRVDILTEWETTVRNETMFDFETSYLTPTEDLKSIRISASQLKNDNNELIGYFGTVYELG